MSVWNRADSWLQARRLEPALADAKEARAMLEQLLAMNGIAPLRKRAAETLPLMTEHRMVTNFYAYYARSDEGVRERVVPVADCVEPLGDGRFIARFGFTNPNFGGKYVPIGLANWMQPEPKDAGQPVWIWPMGTIHKAFAVTSAGRAVEWHLDGHVAVVEGFKGVESGSVVIVDGYDGGCSKTLVTTGLYVIHAWYRDGVLHTNLCSQTIEASRWEIALPVAALGWWWRLPFQRCR